MSATAILADLNEPQRQAVAYQGSHLLVVAGAGTGKTRVLTYRIAYQLATGHLKPQQVLALTFTNKAASEMRERLAQLIGPSSASLTAGTFHSVCARFLRQHGSRIGIDPSFIIYDEHDQKSLVRRCMQALNMDPARLRPRELMERIEQHKNAGRLPEEVQVEEFDYFGKQACKLYPVYQAELKRVKALDFTDLLLMMVVLLKRDPLVLAQYQQRFAEVLVDEYQDTNQVQVHLLRLLAAPGSATTVCAVGDDDQSIYTWRGADPGNILRFETDFPGAHVFKLEENYRSTTAILDAANLLIGVNRLRRPKQLFTRAPGGVPPVLYVLSDPTEEALLVVGDLKQSVRQGLVPGDHAILYRTNAQSRAFEDALRLSAMPYTIIGGVRFYDRQEVKDAVSYLRLAFNPDSDADLERVLQRPSRGIGKQSLTALLDKAQASATSALALAAHGDAALKSYGLSGRAAAALVSLRSLICGFSARLGQEPLGDVLRDLLEQAGYLAFLASDDQAEERLQNVDELIALANLRSEEGRPVPHFLEEVSLASDQDLGRFDKSKVTLMTLHAAKGLEFPVVYLVGMEERLLPHYNALKDEERRGPGTSRLAIEEERRLCYVGMTRARKRLVLTAAAVRSVAGSGLRPSEVSRFVHDLAGADLKVVQSPRAIHEQGRLSIRNVPSASPSSPASDEPELDEDPWL